ncbi:MAG: aspartyl protease family protein, partial [Gammaproteobacteria bacterium]
MRAVLALFSLVSLTSLCGAAVAAESSSCRYRLAGVLPLQYRGAGMQLSTEGKINDTPAMILVDTGSQMTALTRLGTDKRKLHLIPTARAAAGVGGTSRLYRVAIRSLELGPVKVSERGSLLAIDAMGGRPEEDAIIGSDFLMGMDLELALADKQLKFHAPQNCADTFLGYWNPNTLVVPLGRDEDGIRPVVTVELNGVKLRALIDTGAANSHVSTKAARRAGVTADSESILDKGTATGIGQSTVETHTARFKSFALGDERIDNPVLRIIDMDRGGIDVILGLDFLRAHRILLANSQKLMYYTYVSGKPFDEGKASDYAWIEKEADAGNSSAQYQLARAKLRTDSPTVRAEGLQLMQRAAAAGNVKAMHFIGAQHYQDGRHADSVAMYEQLEALDPSDLDA